MATVLQGMQGEDLGSLQGAASPPPCGGCATAPVYLQQKEGKSGWWKLRDTKCDFVYPLSLVIKCLGGGGYKSGDLIVPIMDKQPSPSGGQVNT
jgi:hypothetical protein